MIREWPKVYSRKSAARATAHPVQTEEASPSKDGRPRWRARCHGCWWQTAKYLRKQTAEAHGARHTAQYPPPPPAPKVPCPAVHPIYGVHCQFYTSDHQGCGADGEGPVISHHFFTADLGHMMWGA